MESDDDDDIRSLFAGVTLPPIPVDVTEAMRVGRRSGLRRRWTVTAVAAAAVLAVPVGTVALKPTGVSRSAAAAASSGASTVVPTGSGTEPTGACPVTALPTPVGAAGATPVAVDPTGRYIIGTAQHGQNFVSVLWSDGRPQILPIDVDSAQATAVNQHGVVVGLANRGSQEYVFRYQNGIVSLLSGPTGHQHLFPAPVLDAAGNIVVNAEPVGVEATNMITIRWAAGSNQSHQLPLPQEANVFGLADDGSMLGTLYHDGIASAAYLWDPTGHGQVLPDPAGFRVAAYHLRGDWALGLGIATAGPPTASPGTDAYRHSKPAVLWNVRTKRVQVLPVDVAAGVNAAGWTAIVDSSGGAIVRDTQRRPLAVLPGGVGSTPRAISDTNLVVGVAPLTQAAGSASGAAVTWQC